MSTPEKVLGESDKGLNEYTDIRYLSPDECSFSRTSGGFLSLELGSEKYARVNVSRAFPLTYPNKYLSVRDKENKEIGVIADLSQFPDEVKHMILQDLEQRYFAPVIKQVNSLKEEFGYMYCDVETDRGPRRFTVRGNENVINLKEGRILIIDVDGNRFEIQDYRTLDPKSFRVIDSLV
jgi:hypothetical protein